MSYDPRINNGPEPFDLEALRRRDNEREQAERAERAERAREMIEVPEYPNPFRGKPVD